MKNNQNIAFLIIQKDRYIANANIDIPKDIFNVKGFSSSENMEIKQNNTLPINNGYAVKSVNVDSIVPLFPANKRKPKTEIGMINLSDFIFSPPYNSLNEIGSYILTEKHIGSQLLSHNLGKFLDKKLCSLFSFPSKTKTKGVYKPLGCGIYN